MLVSADGEEHVQEAHGRRVRIAEVCFYGREVALVRVTGDGRNKRIADSDAVSAVGMGLLQALHGLAQAAAKTDGDDQVLPPADPGGVGAMPRRDGGSDRESQQSKAILQKVNQAYGEVAAEDQDSASFVNSPGEFSQFVQVEGVAQGMQVSNILLERFAAVGEDAGIGVGLSPHSFE